MLVFSICGTVQPVRSHPLRAAKTNLTRPRCIQLLVANVPFAPLARIKREEIVARNEWPRDPRGLSKEREREHLLDATFARAVPIFPRTFGD